MKKDDICDYILNNEPVFEYNGDEYQIIAPEDGYYIGKTDDETSDVKYDSLEEMLEKHTIDGERISEILEKHIKST